MVLQQRTAPPIPTRPSTEVIKQLLNKKPNPPPPLPPKPNKLKKLKLLLKQLNI
jgi:hypothetical protein